MATTSRNAAFDFHFWCVLDHHDFPQTLEQEPEELTLAHLQSSFMILGMGSVVALLVFLGEFFLHSRPASRRSLAKPGGGAYTVFLRPAVLSGPRRGHSQESKRNKLACCLGVPGLCTSQEHHQPPQAYITTTSSYNHHHGANRQT